MEYSKLRMSKKIYLDMCKQTGRLPDPTRIPLDFEDLEYPARLAYVLFVRLGNRYLSGMAGSVYIGKDYSTLAFLYEIYQVSPEFQRPVFEILHVIDGIEIKDSQKKAEKAAKSS